MGCLTFIQQVKNQMIGLEEDKVCKPYRPISSGRISLGRCQSLYLFLIVLSIAISAHHGLTTVSFVYMLAIGLYNEGRLSMYAIPKSALSAIGYMCYCWGVTYIVGHHQPMSSTSITAILSSGLIFTTTGHAQDFRDRSGDAAVGRRTIPLILSQGVARWSLLLLILAWTCGLILFWHPPMLAAGVFTFLGITCGIRFVANRSEEEDKKSWSWYSLWLVCAHVLPVFERMSSEEISSAFSLGLHLPLFSSVA